MMKWEDITDEARKATEQALTDLLTENRKISGDQLSIRLQDPAYLEKKSATTETLLRRRGFQANETSGGKTPENPFMDPVCQCGMHSDRRNIGHCAETKNRSLTIGRVILFRKSVLPK